MDDSWVAGHHDYARNDEGHYQLVPSEVNTKTTSLYEKLRILAHKIWTVPHYAGL